MSQAESCKPISTINSSGANECMANPGHADALCEEGRHLPDQTASDTALRVENRSCLTPCVGRMALTLKKSWSFAWLSDSLSLNTSQSRGSRKVQVPLTYLQKSKLLAPASKHLVEMSLKESHQVLCMLPVEMTPRARVAGAKTG